MSLRMLVRTFPLQAIAESGSAKVGVVVSSSTGSPCEVTATMPVPSSTTLNIPPARRPAPSTRRISQATSPSKARILSPLTVIPLVLEVDDHDLACILGEEEVADAGGRHELYALAGEGLFEEAPQSPALVFEADVTLVGDHRAELRLDRVVVQPNL